MVKYGLWLMDDKQCWMWDMRYDMWYKKVWYYDHVCKLGPASAEVAHLLQSARTVPYGILPGTAIAGERGGWGPRVGPQTSKKAASYNCRCDGHSGGLTKWAQRASYTLAGSGSRGGQFRPYWIADWRSAFCGELLRVAGGMSAGTDAFVVCCCYVLLLCGMRWCCCYVLFCVL